MIMRANWRAALIAILAVTGMVWLIGGRTDPSSIRLRSAPAGLTVNDGATLFAAAGCANCHTDRPHGGALLAGGAGAGDVVWHVLYAEYLLRS